MTTINANMSNSIDWIPLSASDAATIAPGTYILDSEYIVVGGPHLVRPAQPSSPLNGPWCSRAQAGSTAATHSSGATLTRYYPDAPGGGDGIPQGGPLTADLDAGGHDVTNIANILGGATVEITAATDTGATGANLELLRGNAQALGDGGEASLNAGTGSTGPGGDISLNGGRGGAGQNGGTATVQGGTADAGDGAYGASIAANNGESNGNGGGLVFAAADALSGSGGDGGSVMVLAGAGDGAGAHGNITFIVQGGQVIVTGLPTSDPGVAGALYTTAGALMVSTGS